MTNWELHGGSDLRVYSGGIEMTNHIDELIEEVTRPYHPIDAHDPCVLTKASEPFWHGKVLRAVAEAAYEKGYGDGYAADLAANEAALANARRELAKELLAVGMYYGEITPEKDQVRLLEVLSKLREIAEEG